MQTILLVGDDAILLRTRAAVLRRTGAETVCASGTTALGVQSECECELVVLCHSLPEELSAALARLMHERWPKTRILAVVSARGAWELKRAHSETDEISSSNPERLLERTMELLGVTGAMRRESAAGRGVFVH